MTTNIKEIISKVRKKRIRQRLIKKLIIASDYISSVKKYGINNSK